MSAPSLMSFQPTAGAFRAAARPLRTPRASGNGAAVSCELKEGSKVRVTSPIKVYHVGKFKQGLDLEGMEGVVLGDVRQYNGAELSSTLPWKVQFEAKDGDGKAVKVVAHLEDEEIQEV